VDHSESLDVEEIKQWVESRRVFVEFLSEFEPKNKILYQPWIFMNFPEIKVEDFIDEPLNTMNTLQ
jgi:hypothetical protein